MYTKKQKVLQIQIRVSTNTVDGNRWHIIQIRTFERYVPYPVLFSYIVYRKIEKLIPVEEQNNLMSSINL